MFLHQKRKLEKRGFYDGYQQMAKIAEELGFTFYFWNPPEGKIRPGDMRRGIRMFRVHSEGEEDESV